MLNIAVNDQVVYFPRRTFDMWNARYFIVPMWPNGWMDSFRGYASLLLDSETIYPPKEDFQGPDGQDRAREWSERRDFRILRNRREHPRAWVVHQARTIESTYGLDAGAERQRAMKEITYEDDPIWSDKSRQVFDWRRVVWIENGQQTELAGYFPGQAPHSSEAVTVSYPSPRRVELDVTLKSPGMVVLADIYYPGWDLTIDGAPAPIYQANRAMRGAAVREGRHHLVYSYESPRSFRVGRVVTALGLAAMIAFGIFCRFRPVELSLAETGGTSTSEIDHE